jgi:hypothetical protein
VFFISGCGRVSDYNLDSNKISNTSELIHTFNEMIEENGHNSNVRVPYDSIGVYMSKRSEVFQLGGIWYNVQSSSKQGSYQFETFDCRSVDLKLHCQQNKSLNEVDELVEEITLGDAADLISEVDINLLVDYLKQEYKLVNIESIMVQLKFYSFDNEIITEDTSDYFVEIQCKEDVCQEEESFVINGMKIVVVVNFSIGDDDESFKVYYD